MPVKMYGDAAGSTICQMSLSAGNAEGARGLELNRVDAPDAAIGVDQDRKQRRECDHKNFHLVVNAKKEDYDRQVGRARNWSKYLCDRLKKIIEKAEIAHEQAEKNAE